MSENQGGNAFVGFLLGAAVGAGLALLLAPASGEETRRQIGDTAKRFKDGARDKMDEMKETLKDGAKDVSSAIEAGRDVFRHGAEETAGRRSSSR